MPSSLFTTRGVATHTHIILCIHTQNFLGMMHTNITLIKGFAAEEGKSKDAFFKRAHHPAGRRDPVFSRSHFEVKSRLMFRVNFWKPVALWWQTDPDLAESLHKETLPHVFPTFPLSLSPLCTSSLTLTFMCCFSTSLSLFLSFLSFRRDSHFYLCALFF